MRRIFVLVLITALATVFLVPSVAQATKPLDDVDCVLLLATNNAVQDFLDGLGVETKNFGAAASIPADDWAGANALYVLFSGGDISFESASQWVSTEAKCGLIKPIIDNIRG